jgi:hypothetical protein
VRLTPRWEKEMTQTVVDGQDPAFGSPTKVVGGIYSKDRAHELARDNGWRVEIESVSLPAAADVVAGRSGTQVSPS